MQLHQAPPAFIQEITSIFEGHDVRVFRDPDGEFWFGAKEVVEAVGNQWDHARSIKHVPDHLVVRHTHPPTCSRGVHTSPYFLHEDGLYLYLGRARSKDLIPYQLEVSRVLRKVRRGEIGNPSPAPDTASSSLSGDDPLVQSLRAALDNRERLLKAEQRLNALEAREAKRKERIEQAKALPKPTTDVAPRTRRHDITDLVIGHAMATEREPKSVWRRLYKEFRYREGIDLLQRKRNRNRNRAATSEGVSALDIADELGLFEELYAVAHQLFA